MLHGFLWMIKLYINTEKNIDVMEICVIILCSARKIPDQSYNAQYRLEGRLGVRVCQM